MVWTRSVSAAKLREVEDMVDSQDGAPVERTFIQFNTNLKACELLKAVC